MGTNSGQDPRRHDAEEPEPKSTGTGATRDTGTDVDDAKKAGMRPTGSGGSAPPSETR